MKVKISKHKTQNSNKFKIAKFKSQSLKFPELNFDIYLFFAI